MTLRRSLIAFLALGLLAPPAVAADGPPPTTQGAGPDGVVEPGGGSRLAGLPVGSGTVVTRSQTGGGRVLRATVLRGRWDVPVVAYDHTPGGLSADRSTLVLMRPARLHPARGSSFAVLHAQRLALRRTIALRGSWSFDAVSPDGATIYLIKTARRDLSRYSVWAYDVRAGRLLPGPIVDPSEPDEPMRGAPMTRTTGPGGRWEYTLYGGGDHPFVHALDTVERRSICIDLPKRVNRHLWRQKLELRGARIAVVYRGRVVASAPRGLQRASAAGGPPWAVAALLLTGLIAAAGVRHARRAR